MEVPRNPIESFLGVNCQIFFREMIQFCVFLLQTFQNICLDASKCIKWQTNKNIDSIKDLQFTKASI